MPDRLYNLLPAVYRIRDVEQGEPLRALLGVIETELDRVEADVARLYEGWFIETCDEWIVPYIGDLLRVRPLHTVAGTSVHSQRAYVANTMRYRRRKGTATVLEQLARDVTGWPARAAEFFERLATTQHLNHVRPDSLATASLRSTNTLELVGGPFEQATHTLEVRRIASETAVGRYNIPNVGLFLWRLQSYFVRRATPRAAAEPSDGRYRFSPLGNDLPLFNRPKVEEDITHLAGEVNVPGPLRRRALYDDLVAWRQTLADGGTPASDYFGGEPVLQVFLDSDDPLPPEDLLICHLEDWDDPAWTRPGPVTVGGQVFGRVAVDPVLGRLALVAGEALPTRLEVGYAYGFSGDVGGGPYGRRDTLADSAGAWVRTIDQTNPTADFATLTDALIAWAATTRRTAVLTITDSRTYAEDLTVTLGDGRSLTVQAADGERPVLRGTVVLDGTGGSEAACTFNGLLVEGSVRIENDGLHDCTLRHCTLVPGLTLATDGMPQEPDAASLTVATESDDLLVTLDRCIAGPLRLPDTLRGVVIADSLVQSPRVGGTATRRPALVSGSLAAFPALTSPTPTVQVQRGDAVFAVALAAVPATLAQARDQLQAALGAQPKLADVRVVSAANRLVVVAGTTEAVTLANAGLDATATELRLVEPDARAVEALRSEVRDPFPALRSATPALHATMGGLGPRLVTLAAVPATLAQARDQLHTALRAADPDPAFADALVASLDQQLLVVPGVTGATVHLDFAPADATTLADLGFLENRPALAADDVGAQPGPPATLIRSTFIGTVFVRELTLGSESIFQHAVVAERRQVGCTRFCWLAEGSVTPRRYRCQPDLALEDVADPSQQTNLQTRLTPVYTSLRYGTPGYGQLGRACAIEIRTGAEDGSEMGVFSHLKQPQREANLRTSLDEYLRFGLEAGLIFIT